MEGTVKFFKEKPGWGFIVGDDGVERFVHYSEINMEGFRKVQKGDKVIIVAYALLNPDETIVPTVVMVDENNKII